MTDLFDDIFRTAEIKWGAEAQINMAVEECAELIQALHKFNRGRCDKAAVVDEIADVKIMCRQLELLFNVTDEVDRRIAFKVRRLEKRLDG